MLFIRVKRKKSSYQYKKDMKVKDSWENNKARNCEDSIELFDYESMLFTAKCQTVSNIPGGRYVDTIAPGPFLVRCFVDPRQYKCRPHGLCQTADISGEWIDDDCTQVTDLKKARFLIHDDRNFSGEITSACWSAGCFVLRKNDLIALNTILEAYNITNKDTIDGELVEVD